MGDDHSERYRAHSMRWKGRIGRLVGMGTIVTTMVLASPAPAAAASGEPEMEARLLELVNGDRAALGLPPVALDAGAASRARELAERQREAGALEHTPPAELTSWYVPPNDSVAELLAHTGGTAEAVHAAWLRSDFHRGVLRSEAIDHGGFGLALDADGSVWAVAHLLDGPDPQAAAPEEPAPSGEPVPSDVPEAPSQDTVRSPSSTTAVAAGAPGTPATAAPAPDGPAPDTVDAVDPPAPAGTDLPIVVDPAVAHPVVSDTVPATGAPSGGETVAAGPDAGFRPDVAAAVSGPTVAAAAAARRRRRR